MSYKPDNDLLERIRAGQKSALKTLYLRYREKFTKVFCSKFSCRQNEAQEVYQMTIVLVHENIMAQKITDLNNEHSLWTYIFTTGSNTYKDQLRKQKKITDYPEEYFGELVVEEEDRDRTTQEDTHFNNLSVMEEALFSLGTPCSDILELFYYEGKDMKEITKELNYKNYNTAKNLKYKCLQRLKKAYNKISKSTK